MITENIEFDDIELTGQQVDANHLETLQSFNILSQTFQKLPTTTDVLLTRFMAEPLIVAQKQAEDLTTDFFGKADPILGHQTSTDKLLEEMLHNNSASPIKNILSDGYDDMSHQGIIHNIGVMEHINALYFIPDAVKAFMAKKEGLDKNFAKLPNVLLSQNRVNAKGEKIKDGLRQNFFDFVDIYSPHFTKKMLMGSLKLCIRRHELECFNRLIRINHTKVLRTEHDILRILIHKHASRKRKKTILFAYATMSS